MILHGTTLNPNYWYTWLLRYFPWDKENDVIRDQIVDACKSAELKRKFLAAQNLMLDKVQEIGRTYRGTSCDA